MEGFLMSGFLMVQTILIMGKGVRIMSELREKIKIETKIGEILSEYDKEKMIDLEVRGALYDYFSTLISHERAEAVEDFKKWYNETDLSHFGIPVFINDEAVEEYLSQLTEKGEK